MKYLSLPEQNRRAAVAFALFMKYGAKDYQSAAVTAMIKGESSYDEKAVGDHLEAHSLFQWHNDRRIAMLSRFKIDILTCSFEDACKAAFLEMSQGGYHKVWPMLLSSIDIEEAVTIMVVHFEAPRDTAGAIKTRLGFAKSILAANSVKKV